MKKIILLSLISAGALIASPATLVEISPNTYGKQVFTVGFDSYQNKNSNSDSNNTTNTKNIGDNIGIDLSNKATLKKIGYETGEIYWRGTGGYNVGISSNSNRISIEIGTGISFNLGLLYTNLDISGNYLSLSSSSKSTTSKNKAKSGTGFAGSVGAGIPLGDKIDIGAFYEYGKGNNYATETASEKSSYTSTALKIPLIYKNYKDVSTSFIYTHSTDNFNSLAIPTKNINDSITLSFSWLYNN